MDDLRYPIGKFNTGASDPISPDQIAAAIESIAALPMRLRKETAGMTGEQVDTPYRDGGWTVRQTVHHIADSHINSYIRFRLALTEDQPTIKPYNEKAWAELVDARTGDIELSLSLIDAIHNRWVLLLRSMTPADLKRTFLHPDNGVRGLDWNVLLYAWHGKHHLAHLTGLRDRMGWSRLTVATPTEK